MALFLALFGMVCWGLAPVFGKIGLRDTAPLTALSLRTLIAASLIITWTLFSGGTEQLRQVAPRSWLFIGVEAILATLVGDLAYFAALKYGNLNQVTLVMSSSPLITMWAAYSFLGERPSYHQLLGALFIIWGIFLIGLQPKF